MLDYLYDETFEGLLTCVYHHYYTDRAAGIYPKDDYQPSMLNGFMEVETDQDKADRVYNAIGSKISNYALRLIYRAFLSGIRGKENVILNYILLGFRTGPSVGSLHSVKEVKELEDIARKVGIEQERMLQFVRFEVMETGEPGSPQILYAEVEPDHDVLELAAHHFAERFSHDPLIIHDTGRAKAVVAYGHNWYVTDFDGRHMPDGSELVMSEDERSYQNLWRTYFDHIAIKERINPRCQRNHIPVRYWKHLTEVNLP